VSGWAALKLARRERGVQSHSGFGEVAHA